MNANSGFSLVEIMVSLTVALIVTATAVPAFNGLIEKNRIASTTNTVVLSLNLARSEAVKRRKQVTMRRNSGTGSVWESGWIVFVDDNGNGSQDSGELLLNKFPALANGYTLRTGNNFGDWVAYLPTGRSRAGSGLGNDTFRVCPSDGDKNRASRVIVNQVGRPRSAKTSTQCP